jgi:hypothetical protein
MLVAIIGDGSEPASDAIAITSQKGNTVVFNAENYYDVAVNFYDVGRLHLIHRPMLPRVL